jgi:hypothetical protein
LTPEFLKQFKDSEELNDFMDSFMPKPWSRCWKGKWSTIRHSLDFFRNIKSCLPNAVNNFFYLILDHQFEVGAERDPENVILSETFGGGQATFRKP